MAPLTPLSISYEKLLPMIRDMSDFRWPRLLGTDPSKRDHSKKCVFHKEHGHTTEECRCLHYLVERLIRAGHLKQYLRSDTGDGTIIFPPVDPTRILQPHHGALIMSLEIGDFDVRRILVDLGSSVDLVQASVISHMGHSLTGLENPGQILSGFNGSSTTSLGDIVLPVQTGPITLKIQFFGGTRFITLQCHLGAHMTILHESHPLYISSNGKLPYQGWANRPIWQPVSHSPMLPYSTRSRDQPGGCVPP
ncbi:hypothetical protein CK203_005788 [Vitis vinifera]|uniref:Peptidase A2 domain-containing protein n=1 Tax=Vitis vinifera TaxID=29760 RepID=A0A438K3Z5_VITVI|nr:hypothetical protein CK203_005788 [Vitis vinifera]